MSNQQIEGLKIQYFTTHPLLKTLYYVMGVFVTTMTIVFFNVYYAFSDIKNFDVILHKDLGGIGCLSY